MSSSCIAQVQGQRIWDSRGRPTVEVAIVLEDGTEARGIAPAGASRGTHEAVELRDGGERLAGLDVGQALAAVRGEIAAALVGRDTLDQAGIDATLIALDGTPNKARLGGNALVATSMAVLNAAAAARRLPLWRHLAGERPTSLPLPEIQIFGGGAHAGRRIDIQDLLVMPVGAQTFDEALCMVAEVYRAAGRLMAEKGALAGVADEGGWWPSFGSNEEALEMLTRAIEAAGFRAPDEVAISLDLAASEFGRAGRYRLALEGRDMSTAEWLEVLAGWVARYPILSVEDPVAEDDDAGMVAFTQRFGAKLQIIGDDYLVTNAGRVQQAHAAGACNAVLIKPNQAGTITEARQALDAGQALGWGTVVSARSGETEDTMISHLAVGWNAGQLKVGSFARSERMAKWNECLRIEAGVVRPGVFAGRMALPLV